MINIHIIPTDKLNKGYILGKCIKELSDVKIGQFVKTYHLMFDKEYFQPQNIYITDDEKPKNGDWFICLEHSIEDFKFNSEVAKRLISKQNKELCDWR
jgi:hypothetical protein